MLEHIDSTKHVALGSVMLNRRIDVGHRLLVYLLECDDPEFLDTRLAEVVTQGRDERDRLGFNRLRVVVATGNGRPVSLAAQQAFEQAREKDERLHLHVVDKVSVGDL